MLTILAPLLLLPTMKLKWNQTIFTLATISTLTPAALFLSAGSSHFNPMMMLDPMSKMLISLTLWILPLILMSSQKIATNNNSPRHFVQLMILLTITLILSFAAPNIFMYYILFEASLIPTFLIIMKWGYQPERLQASMYLMLYTVTASLPLLSGIMYVFSGQFYGSFILSNWFPFITSTPFWVMMNLAFMVKLPLFFFHLWLPKAHVEAPVAGSMILAAVLLKLGGYGMLRLHLMMPLTLTPLKMSFSMLALWGGMITSLICIRQQDLKSLIAYSSVGHMSLVIIGLMSSSSWGAYATVTMMIAHGLLSSSMFSGADMTYNMSNSRSLVVNKGLNITLPTFAMMWFIMCAANMAAPPSPNLMAEIMLIIMSLFTNKLMLIPVSIMSFAAAAYSLTLYIAMNHGPINTLHHPNHITPTRNMTIISFHIIPIIIIMLMPTLILLW